MSLASENMLLLGVVHVKRNIKPAQKILKQYGLSGKIILTEGEDLPGKTNQEFYGPIIKFLTSHGAVVLHEIGELDLTRQAVSDFKETIYQEKYAEQIRLAEKFHGDPESHANLKKEAYDDLISAISKRRDPNIIKIIMENAPSMVIVGDGHAERIHPLLQTQMQKPINYVRLI